MNIWNKSKICIVIENEEGEIFGCYINSKIDEVEEDIKDENAFVFNLESNGRHEGPMKFDIKKEKCDEAFLFGLDHYGVLFNCDELALTLQTNGTYRIWYNLTNTSVDFSSIGLSFPYQLLVYNYGFYNGLGIFDDLSEQMTITILEDTEVDASPALGQTRADNGTDNGLRGGYGDLHDITDEGDGQRHRRHDAGRH